MNKLDIFSAHLSLACGPSNWCCDAESAPCPECNSSPSLQSMLAKKSVCKADEEVNKLIITEASCIAIGEAVKSSDNSLWLIILRIKGEKKIGLTLQPELPYSD